MVVCLFDSRNAPQVLSARTRVFLVPPGDGGTLGALLESVAHLELQALTDHPKLPKTISLTVDYLRSGKTKDVFASAKMVKSGRRVTTLQCHAWQEDENAPIATAMVILKVG